MKKRIVLTAALAVSMLMNKGLKAQEAGDDLYDMSLEELMNLSIVSASQQEERLFDAPLASSVITREDMQRAGVSSIPEALRLSPEIVVRETTNGNYDITLRGFDNLAHYTSTAAQANTLSLVMIDSRPVFNYNMGGTFWESLPVDLVDVERIEIVRGPAAPLYGPNAVTGVINIITRKAALKDSFVSANLNQQPDFEGVTAGLRLGHAFTEKLSVGLSANLQKKQRLDALNYTYFPAAIPPAFTPSETYHSQTVAMVDSELAIEKMGANLWLDFAPTEKQSWRLSSGLNTSEAQRIFFSSSTPLTYSTNESRYINLAGEVGKAGVRISYTKGTDELHRESELYSTKYDYSILDADVNYKLQLTEKLQLRPQFSVQQSVYSDDDYFTQQRSGLMGGKENSMNLLAGSLKAEYRPLEALRVIASGRIDKFDVSEKAYFSYQFAGTYGLNKALLFRASHAKSYSGIFYNYRYIDVNIPSFVLFPNGRLEEGVYAMVGNDSDVLTSNTATELGIRYQPEKALQFDLGYFHQRLKDPIAFAFTGKTGTVALAPGVSLPSEEYRYQALPIEAIQQGVTLTATYVPNTKLQLRPFVTWQNTEVDNFDHHNYVNLPLYSGKKVAHESTPEWFGGAFINYAPLKRLNLNLSSYYYSKHLQYHFQDFTLNEAGLASQPEAVIASKVIVNANVSFNVWDKLVLGVGAKNLLDDDAREYYGADRNGRLLFTTLQYNF